MDEWAGARDWRRGCFVRGMRWVGWMGGMNVLDDHDDLFDEVICQSLQKPELFR